MDLAGKRVLVTGGAGFIGSFLVEKLVEKGAAVRVLDDFSSGHADNLASVAGRVEVVRGDVEDAATVRAATKGVDLVSHQAAQLEILKSIGDPVVDLRANTVATVNVLEAARLEGVRRVGWASSACVYGQARGAAQDESHPTLPNWPYGVSKLAAEHYARIYHEYYGMETVGLRYGITYGPREWFGRVLTIFLKRALEGKAPVVFGEGHEERDFVYVEDVADAAVLALETDGVGHANLNVGSGTGTTITSLAALVHRELGTPAPVHEHVREGEVSKEVEGRTRLPAELKRMVLPNGAARKALGWEPKVALRDGLRREFEWLKDHHARWTRYGV